MAIDSISPDEVAMLVHGDEVYGIGTVEKLYAELWPETTFVCLMAGPLYDWLRARNAKVELVEGLRNFTERHSIPTLARLPRVFYEAKRDAKRIHERLEGRGIRIVHAHWRAQQIIAGYLRRMGYRSVWHIHNHTSRSRMFGLSLKLNHRLVRWGSDLILSVSDYIAENWRASGVPVKTVHAGAPQIFATPSELPSSGPVRCLVAGRLVAGKGHHVAIGAVAKARQAGCDVTLDIYGGPLEGNPYADELHRQIKQGGLASAVRLMGLCTDLRQRHQQYHIGLQCGIMPESFGMWVCEAMVDGLPVIAAALGGVLELVVDGVTGYLCPPGDANALAQRILQLQHDRCCWLKCEKLLLSGNRLFSPARFAAETLAAYACGEKVGLETPYGHTLH